MEETNYHRQASAANNSKIDGNGSPVKPETADNPAEKAEAQDELELSANTIEDGRASVSGTRKTYLDKLKLFHTQELRYPNRLKEMALRPIIFLSFPVVSYAGFSYGSNLVWFNVLNGTTSLILSKEPYSFDSSIIGLAYIAPFIGMAIG